MRRHVLFALPLVLLLAAAVACSDSDSADEVTLPITGSACPGDPVDIVVTVGQWADLTTNLAGSCGDVTTIVTGDAGDPHDFEPSPSDRAAFDHADLVVMNGADFDHWAEDALDSSGASPAVVDAAEVVGASEGDNPHLWYSPDAIDQVGAAITAELATLVPDAGSFFADRASDWQSTLMPYTELVDRLAREVGGEPYAATEPVFDPMAQALHLTDVTPQAYRHAAANDSEPSPVALDDFENLLRDGSADVLIFNSQTESALTRQLRTVADDAGVPIVEVTETQPEGTSFVDWQVGQLEALEVALGVHD